MLPRCREPGLMEQRKLSHYSLDIIMWMMIIIMIAPFMTLLCRLWIYSIIINIMIKEVLEKKPIRSTSPTCKLVWGGLKFSTLSHLDWTFSSSTLILQPRVRRKRCQLTTGATDDVLQESVLWCHQPSLAPRHPALEEPGSGAKGLQWGQLGGALKVSCAQCLGVAVGRWWRQFMVVVPQRLVKPRLWQGCTHSKGTAAFLGIAPARLPGCCCCCCC